MPTFVKNIVMLDKVKSANLVNYSPMMPIIDKTIRLLVRDGIMEIQATALDQWYIGQLETNWDGMDVVVDGTQLLSACTLLGEDMMGVIQDGTLVLKSPKGKTKLQLISGDFPDLKRPSEMLADIETAANMSWCCVQDDTKPALAGIFYGEDVVATDMSRIIIKHETNGPGVIIPPHVMKWSGKLSVASDKKSAYVVGDDWFYGSLLIHAPFPPYKKLLAEREECFLTLPKSITYALNNKTVISAGAVRLSNGMLMALSANGEINIELAADIKTDYAIWFNPKRLAEVIEWIGLEEITFTLDAKNPEFRSMIWTDKKRSALIMPIAPAQ